MKHSYSVAAMRTRQFAQSHLLAQLQHRIEYPSAHLDPRVSASAPDVPTWAQTVGGPAFEMTAAEPSAGTTEPAEPGTQREPTDTPITVAEACKRFVLAGRAIFTLQGASTRYTFRVNRADPKPGSQYTQQAYFVSLLTGPDNLSDYTYLGLLHWSTGEVRITRSSKYRADSAPVLAVNWAFRHIWAGRTLPAPAVFYHVGRCARCGRALTVPSSIETGFGPECAGKMEGI